MRLKSRGIGSSARNVASRVPVIGTILDCNKQDIAEAVKEVGLAAIFATLPLWFPLVLGRYLFDYPPDLTELVKSGELFIYSAATCGPLVYIISKKYGDVEAPSWAKGTSLKVSIRFPGGMFFILSALAICLSSGIAMSLLKNPLHLNEAETSHLNQSGISTLSWYFFVFSNSILFLVTSYRNMLEHATELQKNDENEFVNQFGKLEADKDD